MHHCGMRSHSDIVHAIGAQSLASLRGVSLHTARSWAHRDSIPAEHWSSLVREGHASLEELAEAAAARKSAASPAKVLAA